MGEKKKSSANPTVSESSDVIKRVRVTSKCHATPDPPNPARDVTRCWHRIDPYLNAHRGRRQVGGKRQFGFDIRRKSRRIRRGRPALGAAAIVEPIGQVYEGGITEEEGGSKKGEERKKWKKRAGIRAGIRERWPRERERARTTRRRRAFNGVLYRRSNCAYRSVLLRRQRPRSPPADVFGRSRKSHTARCTPVPKSQPADIVISPQRERGVAARDRTDSLGHLPFADRRTSRRGLFPRDFPSTWCHRDLYIRIRDRTRGMRVEQK